MHNCIDDLKHDVLAEIRGRFRAIEGPRAELKDSWKRLCEEREEVERLQQTIAVHKERRQRLARLHAAIEEARARQATTIYNHEAGHPEPDAKSMDPTHPDVNRVLETYLTHNSRLQALVDELHERSFVSIYSRIVSLATGTHENDLSEALLRSLDTGIEAERAAGSDDIGRVRTFLRRRRDDAPDGEEPNQSIGHSNSNGHNEV